MPQFQKNTHRTFANTRGNPASRESLAVTLAQGPQACALPPVGAMGPVLWSAEVLARLWKQVGSRNIYDLESRCSKYCHFAHHTGGRSKHYNRIY